MLPLPCGLANDCSVRVCVFVCVVLVMMQPVRTQGLCLADFGGTVSYVPIFFL